MIFAFTAIEARSEVRVYVFCVCVLSFMLLGVGGLQKPFSPRYPPLRHYPSAERRLVSVSGFSSGGYFTVQLTFIYSSLFSAVGFFSGGPYPIAKLVTGGKFTQALKAKATYPFIEAWAAVGAIDPPTNLRGTRVYTYTGVLDLPLVAKQATKAAVEQFSHYGAIVRNRSWWRNSGHCVLTDNFPPLGDYLPIIGSFGGLCNSGYQAVNDMFQHFYGDDFVAPVANNGTVSGHLFKYDQNEFFDDDFAEGNGFAGAAFAYVPSACAMAWSHERGHPRPCRLHVALHGASVPTAARIFADGFIEFVELAGYLQAAAPTTSSSYFRRAAWSTCLHTTCLAVGPQLLEEARGRG